VSAPARALVAAILVALLAPVPEAIGEPAAPRDLEVAGGGQWQAGVDFELTWRNPLATDAPLAAARYLVRDEANAVVLGPRRTEIPVERIDVAVPRTPGVYTAEVWLEDRAGADGPPATTRLRFDDTLPADVEPLSRPGWIGRAELPLSIRVANPAGGPPPAGIRGYAISVDRDPEGEPCVGRERCSDDETDLRGGPGDDTLAVADLPEGLSYVHAVAVSGSGMRSASSGSTSIRVDRADPVTRLAGVPEGWTDRPVVLRASADDDASGMRGDGPNGPFTAIAIDGGPPSISAGAVAGATVIGSGVHAVAYYARDAAGNVADGATANGQRNPPPSLAWVRIDRDPPAIAFLPSTHPDDPELIEARISDPLSGPGRGWIGVRATGSGAHFEPLRTEADRGLLRARWDSDEYASGEYEFEAVGYDRAGNVADGTRRTSGSPMQLPSPLKTRTVLHAWLGTASRETSRPIPHGRSATYRGRLTLASGWPLAAMPLRVVERFGPGAGIPERVTTVSTGADGRFALCLAPGPGREVLAVFAGSRTRTRASSASARLTVRSGVRLRASSASAAVGGRPVVFRGRVAGEEVPADGLSVQLQFRLPGVPWTEFRTVQTDRDGRFRYAYRFSDDDSRGVRFLFRAYVNAQGDWPYEPGGSLPVAVRGY
jgi:hypothetical protein